MGRGGGGVVDFEENGGKKVFRLGPSVLFCRDVSRDRVWIFDVGRFFSTFLKIRGLLESDDESARKGFSRADCYDYQ